MVACIYCQTEYLLEELDIHEVVILNGIKNDSTILG
jgi:hypothetical protein